MDNIPLAVALSIKKYSTLIDKLIYEWIDKDTGRNKVKGRENIEKMRKYGKTGMQCYMKEFLSRTIHKDVASFHFFIMFFVLQKVKMQILDLNIC